MEHHTKYSRSITVSHSHSPRFNPCSQSCVSIHGRSKWISLSSSQANLKLNQRNASLRTMYLFSIISQSIRVFKCRLGWLSVNSAVYYYYLHILGVKLHFMDVKEAIYHRQIQLRSLIQSSSCCSNGTDHLDFLYFTGHKSLSSKTCPLLRQH